MRRSDPTRLPFLVSENKQLFAEGNDYAERIGFSDPETMIDFGFPPPRGTDTSTIDSGGGSDYTSIQTWMDTECTGTLADNEEGEIQNAAGYAGGGTAFHWDAVTTPGSYWCKLTVKAGSRFTDGANWPDMGAAEGEGAYLNGNGAENVMVSAPGIYIVEWLELDGSGGTTSDYAVTNNGTGSGDDPDIEVRYCLAHDHDLRAFYDRTIIASSYLIHHNAIWDEPSRAMWCRRGVSTWNIYHNTIYNTTGNGIERTDGTVNIYGNVVLGSSGSDFSGTFTARDYNASSDASATGTNSEASVTTADWIDDTTSPDLHHKPASGTYDSSGYSGVSRLDSDNLGASDIDGDAVTQWTMGCHDKPSSGGPSAISGTAAGTGAATGTIHGDGYLGATSDGTGAASGTAFATGVLGGASAGTGAASGNLLNGLTISGTAAGVGAATGTIGATGVLGSSTGGTGAGSGSMTGDGFLVGPAAGVGAASGTLRDKNAVTVDHYRVTLRANRTEPRLRLNRTDHLLRARNERD